MPLYSGNKAPGNYNHKFNTGLWYDKFCKAEDAVEFSL